MKVSDQRQAEAALPKGNDPAAIVQEAGWVTGPGWTGAENFSPTGIRSLDRLACSELLH
jgi:hypothetical protein